MSITVKEKFKTIIRLVLKPQLLIKLISFKSFGYLLQTGWIHSYELNESIDAELKPIPWFTYSSIDFLKEKLTNNLKVLEFGSGNSTLFLSEFVNNIVSIEHNNDWLEKILLKRKENIRMIFTMSSTSEEYLSSIDNESEFDIIIIDGLFRNECMRVSLNHIIESSVIILDDSERAEYQEGISFLTKNGFKRINFSGIAPGIFFKKCTSVFYKSYNCLEI